MRGKILEDDKENPSSPLPAARRRTGAGKPEAELVCPDNLDGDALFHWAMQDVKPIRRKRTVAKRTRPAVAPKEDPFERAFLDGQWALVSSLLAEHIEGAHPSVSRLTMRRLRRGHFSVQAECDLHGMTQWQARHVLRRFIEDCAHRHMGCVRVIHGKGNNSTDKVPVLKTRLQQWLSGKWLSRYVLAYCSARPCDGGTGAVYVLLRKA